MAGDPEELYLRAPMVADMGGELGTEASGLAEMGDGWGRVDMAVLGEQLPTELASAMGSQGIGTEEAIEEVYETPTNIDVWVGDDGYLRRLEFGWSMTDLASALGEDPGELTSLGFGDIRYMMDMYDYGASVDFEPPEDAVDITDAFAALAEGVTPRP